MNCPTRIGENMANAKRDRLGESVTIRGSWYDRYGNIWYDFPRRYKGGSQIPSICLRGDWLLSNGFRLLQQLEIEISPNAITLRAKVDPESSVRLENLAKEKEEGNFR